MIAASKDEIQNYRHITEREQHVSAEPSPEKYSLFDCFPCPELQGTLKIYPFLEKSQTPRYKTRMTFFCTTSPKLAGASHREVLGWAGGCLLLQIPNNNHVPSAPEIHVQSEMHFFMEGNKATLKPSLHFLPRGQLLQSSSTSGYLLSSRKFVHCLTAVLQRLAKGNPQTAKPILDVN